MVNVATKRTVEGSPINVYTPLIELTKVDIIRLGTSLDVSYAFTSSCYDPDEYGRACGKCDSCLIRLAAFKEAGIEDPIAYQ